MTQCAAQGTFLNDTLQQQKTIVNCMAINQDNVMVTGGDNGSLWCAHFQLVYESGTDGTSRLTGCAAADLRALADTLRWLGHEAIAIVRCKLAPYSNLTASATGSSRGLLAVSCTDL